ncbi:glycoside hydrolase N-terminal domain-containing protein [Streptomyces sp. ME02-8801-2C]|uniref:glycosyl hydrolase family 95 catalytic domain-containing protein n=1 Tax=Streptomyces sp. ME02-8801-2C TaxID=3028680 RepID=UPI0029B5391E|nr:glycoside hydrolase N-terminal domain-containing protein [Streptomyces sp. ME02-8801-2C]MDX3456077.1 glycoside hydrolase N-terminal domain-containing protein [Streptomyces sp. ME02-8801-2C]
MTDGPVHGTWEPCPAARWEDGYLSGNGRHGALVFGAPDGDRTVVTHHTLVRPNGSEQARPPQLADQLATVQDRLLAGDTTAAEGFTDGRELQWVQPFHPAFQVRLRGGPPTAEAGEYRRSVDFTTGVVETECEGWRSRVFVSRADDVIVQYVTLAPHLALDIDLDHRLPNAPVELGVGQSVVRTPEGALITLRVRYPGSDRAYTGVTLVVPTGGTTTLVPPGVRAEGAESVLLLTRVVRHIGERDTAEDARTLRGLLSDAEGDERPRSDDGEPGSGDGEARSGERTYDRLLARHIPLHRTAYHRVTLDLDAEQGERALPGTELLARTKSPALLERLFAAGRYHLLSASGMLPPRLPGLWTGDWNTAWSGAFTTNANLNLQTASAVAGALPEVIEAQASLIVRQIDDWRENARAVFGARGLVAPSHTDGESGGAYHFSREYPLHLWTAGADWLLKPLVDHDETEGVRDPRTAALLAEVALFYEDFLTRTDADGNLVVVPSYSPENRPAGASWGAINAAMDLSAARHALLTAAEHHSGDPGDPGNSDRVDRWRALADRLPPHRVNADGALAEWAWPGLDDTYDHRHLSHLYGVWPLDEINPYDTPDLAVAAHRALQLRGAENDSAHGHLHHALIAARLRDGERVTHALGQVLDGDFFHASLMSAHYPGRDVYNADAAHALPAVLIEALIQSTPDRLVLLPALPATWPSGRLRGVRTRFGAEVDLDWGPGRGRAVVRPTRTHRIDLRTSSGARPFDLVAGEDRVLDLGPR